MKELFDCLISTNGMAYGTGVLIFLITLILVAKRVIGFTMTLLFLAFALLASTGVANQGAIRGYLDRLSKGNPSDSTYKAANGTPKEVPLTGQILQAFTDLKSEFQVLKKNMTDYFEQNKPPMKISPNNSLIKQINLTNHPSKTNLTSPGVVDNPMKMMPISPTTFFGNVESGRPVS